ncbi:hypothetical protein ACFSCX_20215 [Bacillus salitolerans]|uniref:Transposase for insertion sequence element IS21-like C-terminal domain-containing protein n=1 Tax=Bacillus salitolerans TaxID=1437434 RepID=A0ABW4LVB8_9BACI
MICCAKVCEPHYEKGILQSKLYLQDKEEWLLLPEKAFQCVRYQELKADKYGFVSLDDKQYSTSPRFSQQRVKLCISYNSVIVLSENNELIVKHSRLYGTRRKSMVWQPYLDLLSKRPKAIKYSSIYNQFPEVWSNYLRNCTEEEQKEALRLVGRLLKNQDFSLLNKALALASQNGHPSADQIKHCFYSLHNNKGTHEAISTNLVVPTLPTVTRGLNHYDTFFKGGVYSNG